MGDEIDSINLSELDIEELERRIELGQMIPPTESPSDCGTFSCGTYRPSLT